MTVYFVIPTNLFDYSLPLYNNKPVDGSYIMLSEIEDNVVVQFIPDTTPTEVYVCCYFLSGYIGWDRESVIDRYPEIITVLLSEEHGEETTI